MESLTRERGGNGFGPLGYIDIRGFGLSGLCAEELSKSVSVVKLMYREL